MASYTVKIENNPGVVFSPAHVLIPGNDVVIRYSARQSETMKLHIGYLKTPVTATFPDGKTIVFPLRTMIDAIEYTDKPNVVYFKMNDAGQPLVLPLPPGQGGGRRNRRRSTRGRRKSRRRVSRRRRA